MSALPAIQLPDLPHASVQHAPQATRFDCRIPENHALTRLAPLLQQCRNPCGFAVMETPTPTS